MKSLFSILLGILSINSFGQQKLNLKKGEVLKLLVNSSQDMNMGMGMEMNSNFTAEYETVVADLENDSIYILLAKISSVKARMSGAGESQQYNSETGEGKDNDLGAALNEQIGRTDTVRVNRYTGVPIAKDSADVSPAQLLNNNGVDMGTITENAFFLLSNSQKPGDKWTVKSKTNGIDSETEYELTQIEENTATINYKTKVKGSTETEAQGVPLTILTNGTVEGSFTANSVSGYIIQKTIESDLTSSMDMMGQTMNISVKGKTTVTNTVK